MQARRSASFRGSAARSAERGTYAVNALARLCAHTQGCASVAAIGKPLGAGREPESTACQPWMLMSGPGASAPKRISSAPRLQVPLRGDADPGPIMPAKSRGSTACERDSLRFYHCGKQSRHTTTLEQLFVAFPIWIGPWFHSWCLGNCAERSHNEGHRDVVADVQLGLCSKRFDGCNIASAPHLMRAGTSAARAYCHARGHRGDVILNIAGLRTVRRNELRGNQQRRYHQRQRLSHLARCHHLRECESRHHHHVLGRRCGPDDYPDKPW